MICLLSLQPVKVQYSLLLCPTSMLNPCRVLLRLHSTLQHRTVTRIILQDMLAANRAGDSGARTGPHSPTAHHHTPLRTPPPPKGASGAHSGWTRRPGRPPLRLGCRTLDVSYARLLGLSHTVRDPTETRTVGQLGL